MNQSGKHFLLQTHCRVLAGSLQTAALPGGRQAAATVVLPRSWDYTQFNYFPEDLGTGLVQQPNAGAWRGRPACEGICCGRSAWGPTPLRAVQPQGRRSGDLPLLKHGIRVRTLPKRFIFVALRALEPCVVSGRGFAIPEGFPAFHDGSNACVSLCK